MRQVAPAAPLSNGSEPRPLSEKTRHRVVIVGGGFGGVFTAKHLRRRARGDVGIELISRNNFFVFRPPPGGCRRQHPSRRCGEPAAAVPAGRFRSRCRSPKDRRGFEDGARDRRSRSRNYGHPLRSAGGRPRTSRRLEPNTRALRPCAGHERRPRRVPDRNHVLGCLEEADTTADPRRKRRLLTFVVVGGGFTGVETLGEMQELIRKSLRLFAIIPASARTR